MHTLRHSSPATRLSIREFRLSLVTSDAIEVLQRPASTGDRSEVTLPVSTEVPVVVASRHSVQIQ